MLLCNVCFTNNARQRSGVPTDSVEANVAIALGSDPAVVFASIRLRSSPSGGRRKKDSGLSTPDGAGFDMEECAVFTVFRDIFLQSSIISFTWVCFHKPPGAKKLLI